MSQTILFYVEKIHTAAIALIILAAVALNFNTPSITELAIKSAATSIVAVSLGWAILKAKKIIGDGKIQEAFPFIVLILLIVFSAAIALNMMSDCNLAYYFPSFQTNGLTGTCELRATQCGYGDPWYFKQGCEISKAQKLELLKSNRIFANLQRDCQNEPVTFSTEIKLKDLGFSCTDIVKTTYEYN